MSLDGTLTSDFEDSEQHGEDSSTKAPTTSKRPLDWWLCCVIMVALSLGSASLVAPAPRLLEKAVCQEYFERHHPGRYPPGAGIPESDCKSGAIQSDFAYYLTATTVGANLVELAMQVPLGILADRKSRKLVLLLNIFSAVLYWSFVTLIGFYRNVFPIWCYFLAPLLLLIGGGPRVSSAMLFTVLSDAVDSENRTTSFSTLEAVSYIIDLFAPVIGSSLMQIALVLPFIWSIVCFAAAFVPTLLLTSRRIQTRPNHQLEQPLDNAAAEPLLNRHSLEDNDTLDGPSHSRCSTKLDSFLSLYTFVWNRNILLCLGASTFIAIARMCVNFLIPYVSQRFNWTIAQAGYLFSVKAGVSALLFLVIIPVAGKLLTTRLHMQETVRDLRIAQVSILLACGGALVIGVTSHFGVLVAGLVVFTLGYGMGISIRSFAAATVDELQVARLFTLISACETVGALVGMPLMATVYSLAFREDSWPKGLLYLLGAVLYSVAGAFSLGINGSITDL